MSKPALAVARRYVCLLQLLCVLAVLHAPAQAAAPAYASTTTSWSGFRFSLEPRSRQVYLGRPHSVDPGRHFCQRGAD